MPGYAFAEAIVESAPNYPDVKFVALDVSEYDLTTAAGTDTYKQDNVYSAVYQEELAGFMGFNGIAATFLGGLHPIGTIFASYFLQHITSGGAFIDKSVYPSQISDLISSIIIYLCGFALFFKYTMNLRIERAEERAVEAAKAEDEKKEASKETEGGRH